MKIRFVSHINYFFLDEFFYENGIIMTDEK